MQPSRHCGRPAFLFLGALFFQAAGAASAAPHVSLVSGRPFAIGDAANAESRFADVTADGRFVAINSWANNLRGGDVDTNASQDVHLLDRSSGQWQLISHRFADPARSAAGTSTAKALSPDGRFLLFESYATDLLATPQAAGISQVYLHDREAGTTLLMSHQPGQFETGASAGASADALSTDSRYLLFTSSSPDLIAGSGSPQRALFLYDRLLGIRLVSRSAASATTYANDWSEASEMSADGRFVLFTSAATDLVSGTVDSAGTRDVFLYDRNSNGIELISRHPAQAGLAVGGFAADLSADGRYVLLSSQGPLQAGMTDANGGAYDCFLHDRQTGQARLVSHSAASASTSGLGESSCIGMSDDGAFVYLSSRAADLVAGFTDANGSQESDLYRFERSTGLLTLVTHSVAAALAGGNDRTFALYNRAVSPDGRYLLYKSEATDLEAGITDTNGRTDLFVYDRSANASTLLTRRGASGLAAGSSDDSQDPVEIDAGGAAYFDNSESLHADPRADLNYRRDVYRFAPDAGEASAISAATVAGRQPLGAPSYALAKNGRWVLWAGWLHDTVKGSNELLGHAASSPQVPANDEVAATAIDLAGRFVLLESPATNLVAGITDPLFESDDLFLYDRNLKTAALVSHKAGSPTVAANAESFALWLSADGQRVILQSGATDLVPGGIPPNSGQQLYFYDRPTDQMRLLSHRHSSPLEPSSGYPGFRAISSDERFLLLESAANDLVPGFVDANGPSSHDLYLYDQLLSQAILISHQAGAANVGGNGWSGNAFPSGDFRYIFFNSVARDLVTSPDLPPSNIVYRWDRLTGANQVVTYLPVCSDFYGSALHDVSLDGRLLLLSTPCGLASGDTNGSLDIYLFDRIAVTYELISHVPGSPQIAKGNSYDGELSDDGRRVVYTELSISTTRATSYDRQTRQEIDLRLPAFDDGTLLSTGWPRVSRDGHRILIPIADPRAAPYDANLDPEVFLVELSRLFADGFESGNTAAWSLALP